MISEVQGAAQPEASQLAVANPAPLNIWIVEDNISDVVLVNLALRKLDLAYDLRHFSDGEAALRGIEDVESVSSSNLPDMILLDLNLPKVDGLSVLRAIRGSQRFAGVPVAILTSSANREDRKAIADLGATRYVQKIANLDEFLSSISTAVLDLRPRAETGTAFAD